MATGTLRRQWTRFILPSHAQWPTTGGWTARYENRTPRMDHDGTLGQAMSALGKMPLMRLGPKASYAAYTAIWNSLHFDPVVASGTTYYQTCAATATGGVTLSRVGQYRRTLTAAATGTALTVKGVRKTLTAASTGTASVTKRITLGAKSVNATGTASLTKGLLYTKLVQVVATGTATMTDRVILGKLLQVVGTGTATVVKRIGKTLVAAGTGTATVSKRVSKTLLFSATGTASMTDVYTGFKLLQINATGAITSFIASFIPGGISVVAKLYRRLLLSYIRRR